MLHARRAMPAHVSYVPADEEKALQRDRKGVHLFCLSATRNASSIIYQASRARKNAATDGRMDAAVQV